MTALRLIHGGCSNVTDIMCLLLERGALRVDQAGEAISDLRDAERGAEVIALPTRGPWTGGNAA